jgi:hypothetical protein
MRVGSVAALDALGFKEALGRPGVTAEMVLEKLVKLRDRAHQRLRTFEEEMVGIKSKWANAQALEPAEIVFISDTIVLGIAVKKEAESDPMARSYALLSVAYLVGQIVSMAVDEPVPFTYRGCITVGQFLTLESFVTGPAVFQAAAAMEQAEAALVWFAPSADELLENTKTRRPGRVLCRHAVPMKGGHSLETTVVSPYASCTGHEQRAAMRARVLATFDPRALGVAIKRQQTDAFLRHHEQLLSDQERAAK